MKAPEWTHHALHRLPGIIEKFMGGRMDGPLKSEEDITVVPSVNITDGATDEFEISVAVPGLSKEDIQIQVEENCLNITSELSTDEYEREIHWKLREFNYSSFQRIFELPENAEPETIRAEMTDGLLIIRIGKKKNIKQNFRKIRVD